MIQVKGLTKRYGPRTAIRDLNFEVQKGEIVGFLGPNGAGKSTTMKILAGFMPASEGTATVAGFDVFNQPLEVKRHVGYLPENPPVYMEMVVADYIEHVARLKQVPSSEIPKAVDQALEKTKLGNVRGRLIGNLSKGYRQRVGLAQALVHNPQVLILDEPTVGLDPVQIIEIRDLVRSLAGDHTVILSSHILPEVTATCRRVLVISGGRIVANDLLERITSSANAGLLYTLELQQPSSTGIEQLRKIPGVVSLQSDGNKVKVEIDPKSADSRAQIVSSACAAGMGVLEFSAQRKSLEEIFIALTTERSAET